MHLGVKTTGHYRQEKNVCVNTQNNKQVNCKFYMTKQKEVNRAMVGVKTREMGKDQII